MELRMVSFSLVVTRGSIWDTDKHNFLEDSCDCLKTHMLTCKSSTKDFLEVALREDAKYWRDAWQILNSESDLFCTLNVNVKFFEIIDYD